MIRKEIPRLSLEISTLGAEAVQLLFTWQRYFYTFPFKLNGLWMGAQDTLKRRHGTPNSSMDKWGNDRHEEAWACKIETGCTAEELHMLQVFDHRIP